MYYLRLWWTFFKNCLSREMEYRGHLVAQVMIDVVWYAVQIGLFEVIYMHTPTVGGLSYPEMMVFLGTLFVVDALNMVFFSTNFWKIPSYVISGELDFYIAKPVSTFFIVFFRYPGVASIMNLVLGTSILIFSIAQIDVPNPWIALVLYPLLMLTGSVVMLAFQTIIAGIAVRVLGADGIQFVFHNLYQFGMKPDQIYTRTIQRILLYVFPMGLIASVPARVLLGQLDPALFIWTVAATCLLMYGALRFFYYSLKAYSGASS